MEMLKELDGSRFPPSQRCLAEFQAESRPDSFLMSHGFAFFLLTNDSAPAR